MIFLIIFFQLIFWNDHLFPAKNQIIYITLKEYLSYSIYLYFSNFSEKLLNNLSF